MRFELDLLTRCAEFERDTGCVIHSVQVRRRTIEDTRTGTGPLHSVGVWAVRR